MKRVAEMASGEMEEEEEVVVTWFGERKVQSLCGGIDGSGRNVIDRRSPPIR